MGLDGDHGTGQRPAKWGTSPLVELDVGDELRALLGCATGSHLKTWLGFTTGAEPTSSITGGAGSSRSSAPDLSNHR